MLGRSARLLFGLFLVELVVFVLAASRFGVLPLFAVVAVMSLVGALYLGRRAPALVRSGIDGLVAGAEENPGAGLGDNALKIGGGVLLAFPGLVSGLLGGLLFLGPIRSLIRPVVAGRASRLVPPQTSESFGGLAGMFRQRDVVDVTSRTKGSSQGTASNGSQPELPRRSV